MPLQLTVEWEEPLAGTKMGYALCDEADQDLQAMQQIFGDDDLTEKGLSLEMLEEWEDPETGVALGFAACDDENMQSAEEQEEEEEDDLAQKEATLHSLGEWEDPETGIALGYAVCDLGDEQADACAGGVAWEDQTTGTIMSFECDEDSDFGDHLELNEEDEVEMFATTDLQYEAKQGKKSRRSKRQFQPSVLRVRRQHLKRVMKSWRSRK